MRKRVVPFCVTLLKALMNILIVTLINNIVFIVIYGLVLFTTLFTFHFVFSFKEHIQFAKSVSDILPTIYGLSVAILTTLTLFYSLDIYNRTDSSKRYYMEIREFSGSLPMRIAKEYDYKASGINCTYEEEIARGSRDDAYEVSGFICKVPLGTAIWEKFKTDVLKIFLGWLVVLIALIFINKENFGWGIEKPNEKNTTK